MLFLFFFMAYWFGIMIGVVATFYCAAWAMDRVATLVLGKGGSADVDS